MKTIWKFPIAVETSPTIEAPGLGPTVMVGSQDNEWMVWCEVDTTGPVRSREFRVVGTGHPLPAENEGFMHAGSWLDGPFVWHLYQRQAAPTSN